MTIKEIVNKYTSLGHNYRNAQNLAASKWLDIEFENIKKTILNYLSSL